MNKQELIEKYEGEFSSIGMNISTTIKFEKLWDDILKLAEPETGHADEAPRYLKNILARLRELPLHDREVWLKAIMGEFEKDFSRAKWREGYEQGKFEGEWVGNQLKDADKIRQELNKPVIPQFVADWIEVCKNSLIFNLKSAMNLNTIMRYSEDKHTLIDWIKVNSNQETFARAWLDGYEVEEEKRYKVVMPNVSSSGGVLTRIKHDDSWIWIDTLGTIVEGRTHTRKELEAAGFGWVFDCPGFEIEEVE